MTFQSSNITEEIKRIERSDQENAEFFTVFIIVQRRKLIIIITEVLRNQSISLFLSFDENDENFDNNKNDNFDIHCFASVICFAKNVKFFNSKYVDNDNFVIVNVDRYIFHRNVYVFDDRLKDLVKDFIEKQRMKKLILECFRDEILK